MTTMTYQGSTQTLRDAIACPGLRVDHLAVVAAMVANADDRGVVSCSVERLVWEAKILDQQVSEAVLGLRDRSWILCSGSWKDLQVKILGHDRCSPACRFFGRDVAPPVNPKENWTGLELRVLARDKGACRYCRGRNWLLIDHVVPRARGGPTTEENLVVACHHCNAIKGGRLLYQARMVLLPIQEAA